jgi:uncharacterized protein YndB with AHSA1/START domain
MAEMQFRTMINRPPEDVFALIADLANYHTWLPPSNLFDKLPDISDNPAKLGTTYVDQGQTIPLRGEVTEFQPPTRITFRQSTQIKRLGLTSGLDIQIRYTLTAIEGGTRVVRDIQLNVGGILKLLEPILIRQIRAENERILAMMKGWMENDERT